MPVINRDELPFSGGAHELEGYLYGNVPACLIFVDGPPRSGPKLHRHPYPEIFVVQGKKRPPSRLAKRRSKHGAARF